MAETNVGEGRRVAIVGAGPTGFYASDQLLGMGFSVDLYDKLPTPFGLVRFGVAPDHPKIKSVTRMYEKTARKDGFRFFGGVGIGEEITTAELRERYHAVLYTTGSSSDNRLGIPGEDRPGSYAATRFVAWYNGHPHARDERFDLSATRAVVVGNGNVAIDVARMLELDEHSRAWLETEADPTSKRNYELLRAYAERPLGDASHRITMRFLRSPVELLGEGEHGHVTGMRIVHNRIQPGRDGALRAVPTDREEVIPCGLVIRSIGYRGTPLGDVPFDERRGLIRNVGGRVCEQDGT